MVSQFHTDANSDISHKQAPTTEPTGWHMTKRRTYCLEAALTRYALWLEARGEAGDMVKIEGGAHGEVLLRNRHRPLD